MKALKVIFGILSLGLWFGVASLWDYYFKHRPTMPQPELGNTYRLENHGAVIYLTLHDASME